MFRGIFAQNVLNSRYINRGLSTNLNPIVKGRNLNFQNFSRRADAVRTISFKDYLMRGSFRFNLFKSTVLRNRRFMNLGTKLLLSSMLLYQGDSEAELEDKVEKSVQINESGAMQMLNNYLIEPTMLFLRFTYLLFNFLPVLFLIPLCFLGRRIKDKDDEPSGRLYWYSLLTRRLELGGATFIKLAQWAASRRDIFPIQLCQRLSALHASVKPHSLSQTRAIIREAYGMEVEDIFEFFETEPMGVGAIAQVYRAKLRPESQPRYVSNGMNSQLALQEREQVRPNPEYVAVKVLHPNVEVIIERDLKIMAVVADLLTLLPTFEWLSLPEEVSVFSEMMRSQVELRNEAENLLRFRSNFNKAYTVKFPRPLVNWTTRKVLVERYEFGVPLKFFLQAKNGTEYDLPLSAIGLDAFLHMLIFDNFIHADLHPGNIMVKFYKPTVASLFSKAMALVTGDQADDESESIGRKLLLKKGKDDDLQAEIKDLYDRGYYPQLVLLDAGLVTTLDEKNRMNFIDLFRAVAEFDGYKAGQLMVERCRSPENVTDGDVFALKMQHLVLEIKSRTFQLSNISISDILAKVMTMVRQHRVKLEGDFVNVVISILILEGIGRSLNPDIDLFQMALPILRDLSYKDRGALKDLKGMPGGASWFLKLWFSLEARQLVAGMANATDSVEKSLFGPLYLTLDDL